MTRKTDRSQETWLLLAAFIVGVSTAMLSITYWGYNLFEGIFLGFLSALPFGVTSRITDIHKQKLTKFLESLQYEAQEWLRIFFHPAEVPETPKEVKPPPSVKRGHPILKLLIPTALIYIITAFFLVTIPGWMTWLAFFIGVFFTLYFYAYATVAKDRKEWKGRHIPSIFSLSIVALPIFFGVAIALEGAVSWNSAALAVMASGLTITIWSSFFQIPLAVIHKYLELKEGEDPLRGYPRVTIIVPAYNEEKGIVHTIESLIEADYPNKEIIVVNDGSTDNTLRIAKKYEAEGVKVLSKDNGGKASAINYALLFSNGDIIITVDADSIIERRAVREIVKKFEDPDVNAVAGNIKVLNRKKFVTKCQALEYIVSINITRRAFDTFGTITVVPGALGAFRKEVVEAGGKYDKDTLTEDFDTTLKILKIGKAVQASSYATAHTQAPDTWRDLYKQRMRWYRGNLQTIYKHRDAITNPRFGFLQRLGFPFMIMNLLMLPFLSIVVWASTTISVLEGAGMQVLWLFLQFLAIQALISILAIQIDEEDYGLTFYSPFFVVGFKQLIDIFLIKAIFDVLFLRDLRWT